MVSVSGVSADNGSDSSKLDQVTSICLTAALCLLVPRYVPECIINAGITVILGFLLIRSNPILAKQLEEGYYDFVEKWLKVLMADKKENNYQIAQVLGEIGSQEKELVFIGHFSLLLDSENVPSKITFEVKGEKPELGTQVTSETVVLKKYALDRIGSVPSGTENTAEELRLREIASEAASREETIIGDEALELPVVVEEETDFFKHVVDNSGILPQIDSDGATSSAFNQFLYRRSSGLLDLTRESAPGECSFEAELTRALRPPVHIQIASDLHIEMVWNHSKLPHHEQQDILNQMIVPVAPYLVLAGDIGCPGDIWGKRQYSQFIEQQAGKFEIVFVIAGNHEYYSDSRAFGQNYSAPSIHETMKEICSKFHNVVFMDRKSAILHGIRLVGVTLWSDIHKDQEIHIEAFVSDYKKIKVPNSDSLFSSTRPLTVKDSRAWHKVDVQFIEWQCKEAEKAEQDVVVISHHSPLMEGTSSASHSSSPMSSAFSTDLSSLMSRTDRIKAWVYGHTHHCADFEFDGVRVVSNQYGYFYDKTEGYKPNFVLVV